MGSEVTSSAGPDLHDSPEGGKAEAHVARPPMSPEEQRVKTEELREKAEKRTAAEQADKQGPEQETIAALEKQIDESTPAPAPSAAAEDPSAKSETDAGEKRNDTIDARANTGAGDLMKVLKDIMSYLRTLFARNGESGGQERGGDAPSAAPDALTQESALRNIDMDRALSAVPNPNLEIGQLKGAMTIIEQQQRDLANEVTLLLNTMRGREPSESERSRFTAMRDKQEALRREYEQANDRKNNLIIEDTNRSRGIFELSSGLGFPREPIEKVQLGQFMPGYAPDGQAEKSNDIVITFKDASLLTAEQQQSLASIGMTVTGNTGIIADPPADFWQSGGRVNDTYVALLNGINGNRGDSPTASHGAPQV